MAATEAENAKLLKVSIFGATNFCQSKGPVPSHSFASSSVEASGHNDQKRDLNASAKKVVTHGSPNPIDIAWRTK